MNRIRVLLLMAVLAVVVAVPVVAQSGEPLRAAVDMGYVPFAFVNENGEELGYAVDLANALAERMGRPSAEIVSVAWSGIFAALDAGRVDFIVAPTNIRPARAENMAFTEPYMDTAQLIAFNIKYAGTVTAFEDLAGLTIGVNAGSVSDDWLVDNQAAYGYKIDRYDNLLDALLAVDTGRIDGVISDYEATAYAAKDRPNVVPGLTITGDEQYGLPCQKNNTEFRNELERALEGIKLDGILQAIHEKWFGVAPGNYSSSNLVYIGYGVPGMSGFQLIYHAPTMK